MSWIPWLLVLSGAVGDMDDKGDAAPNAPQPRLRITERSADFGRRFPGRIEHTFRVENTGRAPLRIDRVKPS